MDPLSATVEEGVNFLAILYDEGIGYSALNTARSALSNVFTLQNNQTFGTHPLVTRFMKGVFETRLSLPRYSETRDVNVVLDYIAGLGQPEDQDLKMLSYKTVMLLALLTGQRRQTLHALDKTNMDLNGEKCTFLITSLLKTSHHLRGNQRRFFIGHQKPYKEISGDTLSRWLKNTLDLAGVNTAKFSAHSTRAAATSAAKAIIIIIIIN